MSQRPIVREIGASQELKALHFNMISLIAMSELDL